MSTDLYLNAKKLGLRHAGQKASEKTLETYRESLARAESTMGKPLIRFSDDDADAMIATFTNRHYSANTINLTLSACRGYFKWAIGQKMTDHNPFDGIVKVKGTVKEPRILSKNEAITIINNAPSKKYRVLFSLLFYGCLRVNEVRTLKVKDIQDTGIIVHGKGDKERFVNLPKRVLKELVAYVGNDTREYVFEKWDDNPITYEAILVVFKSAAERAGFKREDVRIHNLRHSGATILYQASKDIVSTKEHLGHADIKTTMRYVKVSKEDIATSYRKAFG